MYIYTCLKCLNVNILILYSDIYYILLCVCHLMFNGEGNRHEAYSLG